ncbi:hypothetical protein EON81_23720 [bacterium]|nr:MAG: hypothetical protein EON81_23720 [bacterium]
MKRRPFVIVGIGLALGATLFGTLLLKRREQLRWYGQDVPESGLVLNPKGANPGDPLNAERDFARIYQGMIAFRKQFGRLPTAKELDVERLQSGPFPLRQEDLESPDYKLADGVKLDTDHKGYVYDYWVPPRLNGKPKPAYPAPGERDVWISSGDIYIRRHQVVYPDLHSEMNITGCYVVLWSDGKIERIKPGDVLTYADSATSTSYTYPGAAGNPAGLVTQRENQKLVIAKMRDTKNKIVYAD